MPVLVTPTQDDRLLATGRTAGERRFWARFGPQPTGLTLIRESGEWSAVDNPLHSRLEAADLIRDADGQVVKGYFLGGHTHVITQAIADEIEAADLGAVIS